jgi:GntR family transcriptional regulator
VKDGHVVRHVGGRSLSHQTRDALLESVLEGRFADGRIPSEQELGEMLGVSRTTVRSALQSLEQDGLIVRTRGRGTRIRAHASFSALGLQRLISFTTLLQEAGYSTSMKSEWELSDEPSPVARSQLGIARPEPCYVMTRVFYADGQPAILVVDTIPQSAMRIQLTKDDMVSQSIFAFSERFFHAPIDYAVVEIVARVADGLIAKELELEPGTALIELLETHYSADDERLAFSEIRVRQDTVQLSVLRRP